MTTCSHCHRPGHEIEHCPVILAALVAGATRPCRECGVEIDAIGKRVVCADCYASQRRVPGAAQHRPMLGQGRPKIYTVVWSPPGCDYRPGAELIHFEAAVTAGVIDPGLLVRTVIRRDGRSRALYYVTAGCQLNQIAGPAAFRQRQLARPK